MVLVLECAVVLAIASSWLLWSSALWVSDVLQDQLCASFKAAAEATAKAAEATAKAAVAEIATSSINLVARSTQKSLTRETARLEAHAQQLLSPTEEFLREMRRELDEN